MKRLQKGVLISVGENNERQKCLMLDDIVHEEGNSWKKDDFITTKNITDQQIREMSFSDDELASFGYYILSRIRAFIVLDEM